MIKNQIDFSYSAPYYKQGSFGEQTKNVWLIFHGYGQLVEDFQDRFSGIYADKNIFIFPQGLSKFYLKGIDKKIGASWMTAHDREVDILNYIKYLDKIYELEIKPIRKKININILGFSQGVHTATRWIYHSNIHYDKLILWGASIAHEINKDIVSDHFNKGQQIFVIGDQDRFIDASSLEKIENRYKRIGFRCELVKYHGTHDIYPDILKTLI